MKIYSSKGSVEWTRPLQCRLFLLKASLKLTRPFVSIAHTKIQGQAASGESNAPRACSLSEGICYLKGLHRKGRVILFSGAVSSCNLPFNTRCNYIYTPSELHMYEYPVTISTGRISSQRAYPKAVTSNGVLML